MSPFMNLKVSISVLVTMLWLPLWTGYIETGLVGTWVWACIHAWCVRDSRYVHLRTYERIILQLDSRIGHEETSVKIDVEAMVLYLDTQVALPENISSRRGIFGYDWFVLILYTCNMPWNSHFGTLAWNTYRKLSIRIISVNPVYLCLEKCTQFEKHPC